MNRTLFDSRGFAVAYIAPDYHQTIYLWEGRPVAYLFEERHLYGINGRHLGWFVDGIIYDHKGRRIGFTYEMCPVTPDKEPAKGKQYSMNKIRPRWKAPPLPKTKFDLSDEGLSLFLTRGEAPGIQTTIPAENPPDS